MVGYWHFLLKNSWSVAELKRKAAISKDWPCGLTPTHPIIAESLSYDSAKRNSISWYSELHSIGSLVFLLLISGFTFENYGIFSVDRELFSPFQGFRVQFQLLLLNGKHPILWFSDQNRIRNLPITKASATEGGKKLSPGLCYELTGFHNIVHRIHLYYTFLFYHPSLQPSNYSCLFIVLFFKSEIKTEKDYPDQDFLSYH